MHFDDRAVQGNRLQFDCDDLLLLQTGEDPVKHPCFAPTVHAGVDGVPVAQAFGQTAPLTAMFGHVQDGVDDLQVAEAHVPALARQAVGNAMILALGNFHLHILANFSVRVN